MTSLRVANELAAVLLPIGVTGAVLAGICAILAGVAIMRGAGGLCGGAVGVWIPCAMLSVTASFAHQWLPAIASIAMLGGMLVLGGVVRGAANGASPTSERAAAPAITRPTPVREG